MIKIEIKALSVNEVWKGTRFKTHKYKLYERNLSFLLPNLSIEKGVDLELKIRVGFSSKGSDLDNICKPFQDILTKKYGFNDNQIYRLIMEKTIVKKGEEFIEFKITKI